MSLEKNHEKLKFKTRRRKVHQLAQSFLYYNEWYLDVELENARLIGIVSPTVLNLLDILEKAILHDCFPQDALKDRANEQYRKDMNFKEKIRRFGEATAMIKRCKEKLGIGHL